MRRRRCDGRAISSSAPHRRRDVGGRFHAVEVELRFLLRSRRRSDWATSTSPRLGRPGGHRGQRAGQIARLAGVALDLAAGGLGNAAGLEQHDGRDGQLEVGGDALANRGDDAREVEVAAALDFLDDDQPLGAVLADGERGAGALLARSCGRWSTDALDVLRVVVDAVDDDQVLEPAGDEQLAVAQEAQVARAEERPAAVAQPGAGTCAAVSSSRRQ